MTPCNLTVVFARVQARIGRVGKQSAVTDGLALAAHLGVLNRDDINGILENKSAGPEAPHFVYGSITATCTTIQQPGAP